MKKLLLLLLFPLMMFAQDSPLIGDVDCDGEVNSEDASLILQFVTNVIAELPCQDNLTGLTPEQLQEIINMMDNQISINYGGGGGSSNYPAMISSISSESMYLGDAFIYCADLEEDGYSDWFLPNSDQLAYAISGGCEFTDERTGNYLWTTTKEPGNTNSYAMIINESSEETQYAFSYSYGDEKCRCVRFGEGETSEGSGGSSGSSSSILGNSEQPITMIGPMYLSEDAGEDFNFITQYQVSANNPNLSNMYYFDAIRFCLQLEYNGFDDWFLPTFEQVQSWYMNNYEGIVIPNNTDGSKSFWVRITTSSFSSVTGSNPDFISMNINGPDASLPNQPHSLSAIGVNGTRNCFCVR